MISDLDDSVPRGCTNFKAKKRNVQSTFRFQRSSSFEAGAMARSRRALWPPPTSATTPVPARKSQKGQWTQQARRQRSKG